MNPHCLIMTPRGISRADDDSNSEEAVIFVA